MLKFKKVVEEFKEDVKDLMKEFDSELTLNAFVEMDADDMVKIHKCMKLYKKSFEIMDEYVDMIEEQNEKLDKILMLVEELRAK